MTSGWDQLRALVALRWTMVRSRTARRGLLLLAACVPLALAGGALAGRVVPGTLRFKGQLVAPTILLGFALLSVVSPLTAGGGNDLYPDEQLVAFPIRSRTHWLSGLAVLPINLAWTSQLVVLTAATSFALPSTWGTPLAAVTYVAYVAAVTLLGQCVTWTVVGLRQTARGRRAVLLFFGALAAAAAVVARTGHTAVVLDNSPTIRVVFAMLAISTRGAVRSWVTVTGVLAALAAVSYVLGVRACDWALRRPGDAGTHRASRELPTRRRRRTLLGELVAVDRASVWRSASLRRGALVLALLPGTVAAVLGVSWATVVLLPGLVTSGAGLLYGVNAFCLDGSGALWLGSLPHDPRLAIRAKSWLVVESCLVCAGLTLAAALVRVHGTPHAPELVGVGCAVVVTTLLVLGQCLTLSLRHPHRADLRGPRDLPAPPGAMAVYSVRLAAATTLAGLLVAGAARTPWWWAPLLVGAPIAAKSGRTVAKAWRAWDDPHVRARVVVTVAAG
jgi:hypothetical protein